MSAKPPPKKPSKAAAAEAAALIGKLRDPNSGAGADLVRLEVDYRAGVLTIREIGLKHGMSHVMVLKHARAANPPWERDLKSRIKAKADDIVNKITANSEASARGEITVPVTETLAGNRPVVTEQDEAEVVQVNAMAQAQVRLRHRDAIKRFRVLALRLLCEIEAQTELVPHFGTLREKLDQALRANPEDVSALLARSDVEALLSTPTRVKPLKDLAEVLRTLIALEREAFGIAAIKADEEPPKPPPSATADPREAYQWMAAQKSST